MYFFVKNLIRKLNLIFSETIPSCRCLVKDENLQVLQLFITFNNILVSEKIFRKKECGKKTNKT